MQERNVIIIGSGPAGAHAALPLVQAGIRVTMIDGGFTHPRVLDTAPRDNFEDIRRTHADQARWFLGEDYSGIPLAGLKGGAIIGGNRAYVVRDTDKQLPMQTAGAQVLQSLAKGGLGAAWGAECAYLDGVELAAMGLPVDAMTEHYDSVTESVGIAGVQDRPHKMPPLRLDHHATAILVRAKKKESKLRSLQYSVHQTDVAILTAEKKDQNPRIPKREPTTYTDMEYFIDPGRSVYRPQFTIEELELSEHFTLRSGMVAETIEETPDGVIVHVRSLQDGTKESIHGSAVILAAGAVGTARILLRSLRLTDVPVPFLAKGHILVPCLHTAMIGRAGPKERTSLCQVVLTSDTRTTEGLRAGCAQLYSYRSLQLLRMLQSVPLPAPDALGLLSLLVPAMVIADVRFPVPASATSTLSLNADGQVRVAIDIGKEEKRKRAAALARMKKALRTVGLLPLRTVSLEEGSASHYAGTTPVSEKSGASTLSTDARGKLHQMQRVWVADSSTFRSLPAVAPTLTIMANARRVARHMMETL